MVIDLALDTLRQRSKEHLAALERARSLPARTIEPFETIDYLAGEGFRLRTDRAPAVLLGIFGTFSEPELRKDGWAFEWALSAEVSVEGQSREDTMRRAYWYGMTVAQCLIRDMPRAADPIDRLRFTDLDFVNGEGETQQTTLAQAQLTFSVLVHQTLSTTRPPGGPLADPYDPPASWPRVQSAQTTVIKEPLT